MPRRIGTTLISVILLLLAGYGVYAWMVAQRETLPEGIVRGNGRIEADQVDVSPKVAGRIERILVSEGDIVRRQRSWDRLGFLKKGGFLAHRNLQGG